MAAGIVFMWICGQKQVAAAGWGSGAVWAPYKVHPFPLHPISNKDLTQAASRKSRVHGLSKTLGVIE